MKKIGFSFALALLAGQMNVCAQTVSSASLPVIELVGTNAVVLGPVSCYDFKLVKFTFRNPGDVPVEITKVTSTCPCVRGYPQTAVIQPKGEAAITLELNPTLVHGVFKRGIWVVTNDPHNPRILLTVDGEIMPTFEGVPEASIPFRMAGPGSSWTNRLTVTATETNYYLGTPIVHNTDAMQMTVSLVTNKAEKMSYDVTLIVTPKADGRNIIRTDIPVLGRHGLPPLNIGVLGYIGTELTVAPTQISIAAGTPINNIDFRLIVRTSDDQVDPALLTCMPQLDGITYDAAPTVKRKGSFLITVRLTPAAVEALRKMQNAQLTFSYPKYKSVSLPILFEK